MKAKQEEIDRLVRQSLEGTDTGTGDWDLPSDHVWDAVSQRISGGRRRRRAFWWIFAGIIVIALAIFLKPGNHTEQITAEETTPFISGNTSSSENISGERKLELSPSDASQLSVQSDAAEEESPAIGSLTVNTLEKATNPDKRSGTNSHARNIEMRSNSGTPYASGTDAFENASDAVDALKDMEEIMVSGHENVIPEIKSTHAESTHAAIAAASLSTTHYMLSSTPRALPVQDVFAEIKRSKMPSVWALTVAVTPSLGFRRISVPNARPVVRRDLLLRQEDPVMQMGIALGAQHAFNRRVSVGVGMEYSRFLLNSTSRHQIRYTRAGEHLNNSGYYENQYSLNLNTSYGDATTDIVLERSSDAQIEEHRFINLSLQTSQSMQVLQFPVSIRYRVNNRKVGISLLGGISGNLILENEVSLRAVKSLDSDVVRMRSMRRASLSGSRDFALGYQFGVGFDMPLDRRWSIFAEPTFSGYLQSVYRNDQVVVYPMMMDLHLGVRYRL